jgi:hypothetical protein
MSAIRAFGGVAIAAALLAACSPDTGTSALPYSAGTVQGQLRSTQMAGAAATAGTTTGAVTGINPGTTGITRADGTGTVGGPVAGLNTSGSVSRPGVGAPDTQSMPTTTGPKRKKKKVASTTSTTTNN